MNVDVIVIDSGCGYFQKDNVLGGINLCDDGESNFYDNIGHGSAVIDIIMEQNPNSTFFIIKVCNNYNAFSCEVLCRAFDYILSNNISSKIVNISLGMPVLENYIELYTRIKKIYENNMLVLSAYSNEGLISYPAAFDDVIGIDVSPNCKKKHEYEFVENSIINIRGSSSYFRALDHDQKKRLFQGTSFSTSYISGVLLKNWEKIRDLNSDRYFKNALVFLKENAIRIHKYKKTDCLTSHDDILSGVKKAIVYPFNKEMTFFSEISKTDSF